MFDVRWWLYRDSELPNGEVTQCWTQSILIHMQRPTSELMCEFPLSKEEKVPEVLFRACSHVHCVIYA